MPHPHPRLHKLLGLTCLAWGIAGVLVPLAGGAFGFLDTSVNSWLLFLAMVVSALALAQLKFSIGRGQIAVAPDSQPFLIGLLFLPTWQVALAAITFAFLLDVRDYELRISSFNAANAGLSITLAGLAAHQLASMPPSPAQLLPVAIAIAVAFDVVNAVGFGGFLEFRKPGNFAGFVRQVPTVVSSQVLLNLFVLLIVAQFGSAPAWGLGAFVGFQVVAFAATHVANSEQVQRRRGDFLQDTFSRYVPSSVVAELVGHDMHIELGGQQREITVLFCDIRGFTSWSENREAQEIITELNSLLSELSAAVIEHEGTLDKFTGDGLMAFWGAPLPTDDHASRACAAALEMISRLEALNHERVRAGQEPFAIGVGVHSGPAVVGNVGHEQRLDYTAIGDTVNLAARLEAATKEIGSVLLVSSATQERLPTGLRTRSMRIGEISVKGRRQPVEVYALQPRRPGLEDIADPDDAGVAPSTFTSFLQDEPDSDTRLLDDDSAMAA